MFKALLAFLKLKLKQNKIKLSEIPLVDLGVDSFKDNIFSNVIILISLNVNHVIESFLLHRPHHLLIQLDLLTLIKLPSSVFVMVIVIAVCSSQPTPSGAIVDVGVPVSGVAPFTAVAAVAAAVTTLELKPAILAFVAVHTVYA